MKLPWKIVKSDWTPADEKIEKIKSILFPPLSLEQQISKDGEVMKFHIDHSVDSNLDAALVDLQDGNNDQVVHKTINSTIKRLIEVRRLLEAYAEIDKDARYIIVEDMEGNNNEDIQAQEDREY